MMKVFVVHIYDAADHLHDYSVHQTIEGARREAATAVVGGSFEKRPLQNFEAEVRRVIDEIDEEPGVGRQHVRCDAWHAHIDVMQVSTGDRPSTVLDRQHEDELWGTINRYAVVHRGDFSQDCRERVQARAGVRALLAEVLAKRRLDKRAPDALVKHLREELASAVQERAAYRDMAAELFATANAHVALGMPDLWERARKLLTRRLKVSIEQEGGWWVGTILEHYIVSQARSRDALIEEMKRIWMCTVQADREEGLDEAVTSAAATMAPQLEAEIECARVLMPRLVAELERLRSQLADHETLHKATVARALEIVDALHRLTNYSIERVREFVDSLHRFASVEPAVDREPFARRGGDLIARATPGLDPTIMLKAAARALGWRTDFACDDAPLTWERVLEEIAKRRKLPIMPHADAIALARRGLRKWTSGVHDPEVALSRDVCFALLRITGATPGDVDVQDLTGAEQATADLRVLYDRLEAHGFSGLNSENDETTGKPWDPVVGTIARGIDWLGVQRRNIEHERDMYRAQLCDLLAAAQRHQADHAAMTPLWARTRKLLKEGPPELHASKGSMKQATIDMDASGEHSFDITRDAMDPPSSGQVADVAHYFDYGHLWRQYRESRDYVGTLEREREQFIAAALRDVAAHDRLFIEVERMRPVYEAAKKMRAGVPVDAPEMRERGFYATTCDLVEAVDQALRRLHSPRKDPDHGEARSP